MPSAIASADRLLRKAWPYLLVAVLLATAGGLVWGYRDRWRSPGALYAEAQTAKPERAARLYEQLAVREPKLAEYFRLWSAQANMPSMEAVSALVEVTQYRPDSPAAYQAHLELARYYARIESPETVAHYRAALRLDDAVGPGLELARYLEEQNAPAGAYSQYQEILGQARLDAFADMRRSAPDVLALAEDLLGRLFYTDVLDVLRTSQACQAHCQRAQALSALDRADEAVQEQAACDACSAEAGSRDDAPSDEAGARANAEPESPVVEEQPKEEATVQGSEAAVPEDQTPSEEAGEAGPEANPALSAEEETLKRILAENADWLASSDPVDWWRATWDLDLAAILSPTLPVDDVLALYLRIAASDVYVADDAAYRALVLARRTGAAQAEALALAELARMQPNWLAWRAIQGVPLDTASPYPDQAVTLLTGELLAKVAALESFGRADLARDELLFGAKVSETPEVIVTLAQALSERGEVYAAYLLATDLLRRHPSMPAACWEMAYPRAYGGLVQSWSDTYDVDPALIWSVMRQESTFRPEVTSSAGAVGLLQLMPSNVVGFSAELGMNSAPGDGHRAEVGIQLGAWHLSELLQRYDGRVILALMAYNAGAGNVDAWLAEPTAADEDDLLRFVPFGETREYVARVMLNYVIYQRLYGDHAGG